MAKTLNLRDKTFSCWKLHIGVTKENFKLIMRQSPLHQIEGYYAILAATERYIEDIDSIHILYISVVNFFIVSADSFSNRSRFFQSLQECQQSGEVVHLVLGHPK